jgi:hypothetical protein
MEMAVSRFNEASDYKILYIRLRGLCGKTEFVRDEPRGLRRAGPRVIDEPRKRGHHALFSC